VAVSTSEGVTSVPTVVIVGAGFGGLNAPARCPCTGGRFGDRNNFTFSATLLSSRTGLEPRRFGENGATRGLARPKELRFRMVDVTSVDFAARGSRPAPVYRVRFLVWRRWRDELLRAGLDGSARPGLKDIPTRSRLHHVLTFERPSDRTETAAGVLTLSWSGWATASRWAARSRS